ncbi:MAG: flavodoxin family protein [Patescibacteria group bacterium]|nr:flavodoxin family protein [Patescibacteria group bacterium]
MKSLIIYLSFHHQNTEKVAQVMAHFLKAKLVKPPEIQPAEVLNYDLIGFGSGIYFGQYHHRLIEFVKNLPPVQNKKAFIFSTSGRPESIFYNFFTRNFRKILEAKGFKVIGQFNCPGFDTFGLLKIIGGLNKGRPNEKDLEKAKNFVQDLVKINF